MDDLLLALAFVLGVGLLPARALAPGWGVAVPLTAPVTGVLCAVSAVASLVTRSPLLPWLVISIVSTSAAAAGVLRRRRPEHGGGSSRQIITDLTTRDGSVATGRGHPAPVGLSLTAGVALLSAPILLSTLAPPVTYDARAIWFFHGAWFWRGGDAVQNAMANPFLSYSHPQYPPLPSASIGALWSMVNGGAFPQAQALLAVMTWLTLVLVVALVASAVATPWGRLTAGAGGAVFIWAAVGLGEGFAMRGYVDVLWAAAAVAGGIAALVLPPSTVNARVAAVCFAAASLSKAEGLLVVAGVLLPLAALRHFAFRGRRAWPLVTVLALGPLAGVAWLPLAQHYSARSEATSLGKSLVALLRGESQQLDRLQPTLTELWAQSHRALLALAVLAIGGTCLLGRQRRALRLGASGWCLAAVSGAFTTLTMIYVAGTQNLDWWLDTSATRTLTIVELLVLTEALVWLAVAADTISPATPSVRTQRAG
jgi:hypothetical protein